MRIAIDVRVLMERQYSGVPEYVYNLITTLLEIDQQNEYLLFYNSATKVDLPKFANPNVRYIGRHIPNKILNYGLFKTLHYPTVNKLIGEPIDLFFMPHLNFIAKDSSVPSILTVHDLSFLRSPEFFSIKKNIWHLSINTKPLIKSFDQVVAISEQTKRDIVELTKTPEEKIKVIYGAVAGDFKQLADDDEELISIKQKYNLPKRFILSLGTIEPRKNISALIKAYEELRRTNQGLGDVKLIIAGGDGWMFDAVHGLADKSVYKNDIKFLGFVDRDDKVALYNLASVFAFPSFYEGFGFPPLEAMSCGCPVVASWGSSLSEVISNAGILIDPYNINDLSSALANVLNNPTLADQLKQAGLTQSQKFTWQKTAEQYLDLFAK